MSMFETLEITSGFLHCGSPDGSCRGGLAGTGFTINYFDLGDCGSHCSSYVMNLGIPGIVNHGWDAIVTVGTQTCHYPIFGAPPNVTEFCGSILLTAIGTPDPSGNFTLPFTAGGHLTVGNGYDIIGGGTLNSILVTQPFFEYGQSWTFSVPEPSTSLLLVLGVISFAVQRWFTWRRA